MRHVQTMAKKSLNYYFRGGGHCVHHIYTVLKLFEITVCFAHFSFFEIDTTVMRAVLSMTKSLNHYFPRTHTVYIAFKLF